MSDEVARILMENRSLATLDPEGSPVVSEEDFDEKAYLKRNPDVAQCVARGMFPSGYDHYKNYGRHEGRSLLQVDPGPRDKIIPSPESKLGSQLLEVLERVSIDAVLMSPSGAIMIVGWVHDIADPINSIFVNCAQWQFTMSAAGLIRVRRQDVEDAHGVGTNYPYGFFGLYFGNAPLSIPAACELTIATMSGRSRTVTVSPNNQTDFALLEVALTYLAESKFFSNYQWEAISKVSNGFGNQVVSLNRHITQGFVANPYIERFGLVSRPLRGSIVVCLYGRIEYLFLQSALFSKLPGIDEYEFIYVSNSPELSEALLREAKLASGIYQQCITIVLLEGNAGFGAANNVAARAARSNRILIVNPDVFPHDQEWALKHTLLIEARPKEETQIFGVPLYYDDGSLMHGGMYFDLDIGVLPQNGRFEKLKLVRVEHYGKGAPKSLRKFTEPRPVPAVTGAFLSLDRAWFEKLGGFTEDYVFGHYEDADLCLKSTIKGTIPWIHDLRLWHLEGKGSTRRPVHEGGSLVNRWLFSSRWSGLIENALVGPNPDLDNLKVMVDEAINEGHSTLENDNKKYVGHRLETHLVRVDKQSASDPISSSNRDGSNTQKEKILKLKKVARRRENQRK